MPDPTRRDDAPRDEAPRDDPHHEDVHAPSALFDRVAAVLSANYYDVTYRASVLPALIARYRTAARASTSPLHEREVVRSFLAQIPASHLTLLSTTGRDLLQDELFGRPRPTLGFQLARVDGRYFVSMLLMGGPAAEAGIRSWDEIEAIGGVAPAESARLDWRTDDAHLNDTRDLPMHAVLVRDGESVRLTVVRRLGERHVVTVVARPYSAMEAARRSVACVDHGGVRVGYLRFWYLHMTGVPELLDDALSGALADSQALVIDLRGRGGSAPVVSRLLRLLEAGPTRRFRGPVVALIDRQARSGKEALAYELRARGVARLVGEATSGAVIPAAFAELGMDAVLMFPPMTLPVYSEKLELQPTPPDVAVAWGGPYSGDTDPIRQAGLDEAARLVAELGPGDVLPRPVTAAAIADGDSTDVLPNAPTLDQLLEAMTTAYGGAESLRRINGLTASGTARIVDTPIEGHYEVEFTSASTMTAVMELGATIRLTQGVDHDGAWVIPPGSSTPQRVPITDADTLRWQSLLQLPLQLRVAFPEIAVDGVARFDGHPCAQLRLRANDPESAVAYVDLETGLPRGMRKRARTALGVTDLTIYVRSYRWVDGVPVPDFIVQDVAAQQTEIRLETIVLR
jgi:C-terminal processing protease CtpA/Prc